MSRIVRSIKNVTNGYSNSQVKVRNATSNDELGPSNSEMQELAELTFQNHELFLIMDMLDKRLNDKGKNWRHVVKSLTVLDYLVHYGSDNVIIWCRENLYIVKSLREFQYRDENGRDQGVAIRDRAKELTSLLLDVERLKTVRARNRRGGRGDDGRRYRGRRFADEEDDRAPRRPSRPQGNADEDDPELRRAIELSKQSMEEDERRRAQMRSASSDDVNKAIQMSQYGQAPQNQFNGNLIDTTDSVYYQQPVEQVPTGYLQYSATGMPYTDDALQQYRMAQQQFQQQQALLQQQYDEQQAQYAALQQQQLQAQQTAQLYEQYQLQQQQLQQQQQQQYQTQPEPLQPLKTGSNNPFAAFNQSQAQAQAQTSYQQPQATGPQPRLRRMPSTISSQSVDQLEQVLSLEAPADTFGNTGSARIPSQHTSRSFINSNGQNLTGTPTGGYGGVSGTNNPFGAQYTGIATTQMQPSHTGYGFGNSEASRSKSNLIDL